MLPPDIAGAFHSTKISGNSGSKSNGTKSFRKLVSKILVNLSRLSFFFSQIWKFGKFPIPFGISTHYESAPVHLVVKSYKMAASRHSQNDLPQLEPFIDCVSSKNVRMYFSGKLWTGRSEFPVGICLVCIISREKSSQVSYLTKIIL